MHSLPQIPTDAPESTPSFSTRRWIRNAILIVAGLVLAAGALLPQVVRTGCGRSDQTEAVSNARQIGLALFEFETAYGSMPDALTAAKVRNETGSKLPLGMKTSNDVFRQLIAAEVCQSEGMFYARIAGTHKPDHQINGNQALAKGECGFTYLFGAVEHCNPKRPLVITPMIPGTDRFDPNPFEGKAVVLRADNSVMSYPIDKQGHVIFEGRNLMDPQHPVWDGHAPAIAWPDL